MDTEKVLEKMRANARNRQEEADIFNQAADIIQGTLETQAIALENRYRQEIETKTADISAKEALIIEKDSIITGLQTIVEAKEIELDNLKKQPREEILEVIEELK